ncbi:MAG TPA: UDP-N-acetylglucosamine 2-epimerase (non-hydrolyzing) [Alphaproteobacteria bacterium]|nr:UDP-N-acetylglucosamine 2-epimerase (non-hydrolyzing) [Alphaproteobacteria bacterium]
MRLVSVVGARPQFVKAAVVSRALLEAGIEERLLHTGQHYDSLMSDVFFSEFNLPVPYRNLGVGSSSHAVQTGEMMIRLEPVIDQCEPDGIIVYGDTNSTLAASLVAAKLNLPIIHVEAGLRSFDRSMPEEINRLVADRLGDLLLAPTADAATQLRSEGVTAAIEVVGDVMVDLALETLRRLPCEPAVLRRFQLASKSFGVATIHRASNTSDIAVFARLIAGLRATPLTIVFPVHPRTLGLCKTLNVGSGDNIITCEPLGYADMLALQAHARIVLTDSGGIQKEAVTVGTPVVTLRDRTEWTQTLDEGWNVIAGDKPESISRAAQRQPPKRRIYPYGQGDSARLIVDAIRTHVPAAKRVATCAS